MKPLDNLCHPVSVIKEAQELMADAFGAAQPNISPKDISNYELAELSEKSMNNVVNELNSLTKLIRLKNDEIKHLDNLVKSRFVELFGDSGKQVLLSDYVWFQEGPGVRSVDFTKEGTILLTGSNINNNEISFGHKSDRFISNELANGKYAHFMCDKDDILVVSSAIDPNRFDEKVTIVQESKKYC